jgi:hypothetical protein
MKRGHAWEEYLARRNDTFTNVYRKQLNTWLVWHERLSIENLYYSTETRSEVTGELRVHILAKNNVQY